jgi:hypothetical protein
MGDIMSVHSFGTGANKPEYVAISGTGGTPAITQTKTVTTTPETFTYTLSDLTGGAGLDSSKFSAIFLVANVKLDAGSSNSINSVSATFPDGTDHYLLAAEMDDGDDDVLQHEMVRVPINQGQITLSLILTLEEDAGASQVGYTIIGAEQAN